MQWQRTSTDDSRLRGALPRADMRKQFDRPIASIGCSGAERLWAKPPEPERFQVVN